MNWQFLPHGRYPSGRYAWCSQCGKEPAPTGCFVVEGDVIGGRAEEPSVASYRAGLCVPCMYETIRESKKTKKEQG